MKCQFEPIELVFDKPTSVRFEFDGELALQQRLSGKQSFDLCGLVPAFPGRLELYLDDRLVNFWDFGGGHCQCS
ncbi:MAG: hypothetical protein KGS72_18350 [Cyanobacteria bacterium REEB67]|nr:hypothetical protein [Cyanobacteria bacterium REEB67]